MKPALILAIVAFCLAVAVPAPAQNVSSGYAKLADGVYAFTADGGDAGAVIGCEMGNDVRILVSKDYGAIESFSVAEQLKLKGVDVQPVLVTAGMDKDGVPVALVLGVGSGDQGEWASFYKLRFAADGITTEAYPTKVVAGVFEEPGSWADLCPFYAREETKTGWSSLYSKSYVFARPDGTFAGLLWRESGIWSVAFSGGEIAVDRIYAPEDGYTLSPVWNATHSPKGKLGAVITLARTGESAFLVPTAPETKPDAAPEETGGETGSSGESAAPPPAESGTGEETAPPEGGEGGGETGTGQDETATGQEASAPPAVPEEVPAPAPMPRVKLVFLTSYQKDVKAITIAKMDTPPAMLSCALAVDGRPFAYWAVPTADKTAYRISYWGLSFLDNAKIKQLDYSPRTSSPPPLAAMRGLGLPALLGESGGSVVTYLNGGKSPEWVTASEYKPAGAVKGFGAVMGVTSTAYFFLDGESLFWHWHRNK